jgi:hypothetical protein
MRQLVARLDMIAVLIQLVQVRGRDLLEQYRCRVHQKLVRMAWNARG